MIARLAAVIAVCALHVTIVGIEPHRAVAHARVQGQFLRELPAGLQIRIHVPHQITFVATFIALHTVIRNAVTHNKVFVAATIFAHVFVIKTGRDRYGNQQFTAVRPAGIDTLIVTLHVDYAARVGRAKLRLIRNRLVLRHFALARIGHHAEIVLLA
ncbi:hypothetical protein D3C78_1182620 [compost metagenome]